MATLVSDSTTGVSVSTSGYTQLFSGTSFRGWQIITIEETSDNKSMGTVIYFDSGDTKAGYLARQFGSMYMSSYSDDYDFIFPNDTRVYRFQKDGSNIYSVQLDSGTTVTANFHISALQI